MDVRVKVYVNIYCRLHMKRSDMICKCVEEDILWHSSPQNIRLSDITLKKIQGFKSATIK